MNTMLQPHFGANIEYNKTLQSGIEQAKKLAQSKDYREQMEASQFANSLDYLKNDATFDIYSVNES